MREAWDPDSCCFLPSLLLLISSPCPSPSCLSLVQVRSSLGTNILSAMAAFAGTAILLMDFGVTSWVCRRVPPAVGTHGGPQMQTQGLGQARVRSTRGPGPWALAGPAGPNRPHQYTDLY